MENEVFLFRDFFNKNVISLFAIRIKEQFTAFNEIDFLDFIVPKLAELSLSQRSKLIAEALEIFLPADFNTAVEILLNALPPALEGEAYDGSSGFMILPQNEFVVRRGMSKEHWATSMKALEEMTKRSTSEFGIRYFLEKFPKETLEQMKLWAKSPNVHIRRLASEGSRPLLPWGIRLQEFRKNPHPVLEILELLKNEETLLVRKSVANNLNDIAKDNPDVVIQTLARWNKEIDNDNMKWLTKHSLRTLIKKGNSEALKLIGFENRADIEIQNFQLSKDSLQIGEDLYFSFEIISKSNTNQKLMIDYIVHYNKANGKQAAKVFKLNSKDIEANQTISIKKKQHFKQTTIRKLYAGKHAIELQINGLIFNKLEFWLKDC